MKKLALTFIFTLLMCICSCAENILPKERFELPIRLTANLSGTDARFTAEICDTHCNIVFDENHALAGTVLYFSENGNTASSGGFTRSVEKGIFPAQESLVKSIRLLASTDVLGFETENGTKYAIDEMTIMVYYDKDTNKIIGIGTEEGGRRFEFSVISLEPYETQSNGADKS